MSVSNCELDLHDLVLLNSFIGQNWGMFLSFLEEHGLDETESTELSDRLQKTIDSN